MGARHPTYFRESRAHWVHAALLGLVDYLNLGSSIRCASVFADLSPLNLLVARIAAGKPAPSGSHHSVQRAGSLVALGNHGEEGNVNAGAAGDTDIEGRENAR